MALLLLAAWFVFEQNNLIIISITDLISSISVLGDIPNFKSLVSAFCENKILRILEIPRNLKYLKHGSNNDSAD